MSQETVQAVHCDSAVHWLPPAANEAAPLPPPNLPEAFLCPQEAVCVAESHMRNHMGSSSALPGISCMTLDKSFYFPQPHFSSVKSEAWTR